MIQCAHTACDAEASGPQAKYCTRHAAVRRAKPLKWKPTPEIDAMISEAWRSSAHGKAAALYVHERTGWPAWKIKVRAAELGLARLKRKEPQWSKAEIEVLERNAWMCPERIRMKLRSAGFERTRTSIVLKRKRLRLLSNLDGYSAHGLADLMGENSAKVRRWIRFGWLKAERRGQDRTEAQGGDAWYIAHESVYRFVLAHPEEIDLCNVDKLWFLDLITKGKIGLGAEAPE